VEHSANYLLWVIAARAHQRLGQFVQAGECVDKALKIDPNNAEAIYAKSDLLYRSDRLNDAEKYLIEAIARLDTNSARPLRLLYATVLQKAKKYEEAQALYKQLTEEQPDNWLYWNNLGMVRQDLSQFNEMDEAYQHSSEVSKDNPTPYFNRIVGAHYNPERSAEDILELCKHWQDKFPPRSVKRAIAKNKAPDKCLRIGLISDGLRLHPVGQMIVMGLEHIPASQIEFYAYSTNYQEDHLTHRLKRMCANWRVIEHVGVTELDAMIREDVISAAEKLVAIGCFCIGTNQVDLAAAAKRGVPVFNAPFSNTRSVAELVIGELLLLLRGIPEANAKAHRGIWNKLASGSFEARGKKLGIIGYGHIGTQLGILAESLGMNVFFYDIESKLPLGNATQVQHLSDLLNMSDVVSLHVPENASTKNMMGAEELALMKPGSLLINAARGTVVDIPALADALKRKHLAGAAIDVFPTEPATNSDPFTSPLCEFDNVILTPHIGGSTQEAQENIGLEVAGKLSKYSDNGSTLSAVNFPEVSLPLHGGRRLLHIHENRPGVLTALNQIFAEQGVNIAAQYLQTNAQMGYVVIDIEADEDVAEKALQSMKAIPGTIRARLLY
jgi:D-3-phosphoglycerate dehydrogenase